MNNVLWINGVWLAWMGLRLWLSDHQFQSLVWKERKLRQGANAIGHEAKDVVIMQPILSGDPTLEKNLRRNLGNNPGLSFLWLLDESDREAQRIAGVLMGEAPLRGWRIDTLNTPPAPPGINPKTFKLQIGMGRVRDCFAVLDDDTILPAGSLTRACAYLSVGALVTGLPFYENNSTFWSSLVTAFVNGNSPVTFLPLLAFQKPATINGMFYVSRKQWVELVGGFEAISSQLCDDFELAKLFRSRGLAIAQTPIPHPISTTVTGFGHYIQLMHRWMIFANRFLRESLSLPVVLLVVGPALMTPVVLAGSCFFGGVRGMMICFGAVTIKSLGTARLRRKHFSTRPPPRLILFEMALDLILAFHVLHSWLRPHRIQWRSRSIQLSEKGLHVHPSI